MCEELVVDSWHTKNHKCSNERFDPQHPANIGVCDGCNTIAAEQLWTVANRLILFVGEYSRTNARLFLRAYCVWRNTYVRGGFVRDVKPAGIPPRTLQRDRRRTRNV